MPRYVDADALWQNLPNDLPFKASVKRVLMQAPTVDAEDLLIKDDRVIFLPLAVGDIVYAKRRCGYEDGNPLYEVAPYVVTSIQITQNKKMEWSKKYRAMLICNGKAVDEQLNFNFADIGVDVFTDRLGLVDAGERRDSDE
jgi:hypothetical protein